MKNQKPSISEEIQKLDEMRHRLGESMVQMRESAFRRFPFLFIFLSTFGVAATFLGMEKIIDQVRIFQDHPYMILAAGISTLILTGALYKKLS